MYCTNCGNQLNDKAVVCPKCGCIANSEMYHAAFNAVNSNNENTSSDMPVPSDNIQNNSTASANNSTAQAKPTVEDKPNPGISLLSFFMPIAGLVIYFADHKTKPIACKRYLLWSIVSFILYGLFFVVYFIALFVIMFLTSSM